MKKYLILLLCLGGSLSAYPKHTPEITQHIQALYRYKESKELIEKVEGAGPITIKTSKMGAYASNAAWYPNERLITLNVSNQRTYGSLVRSIVFELHNALNQDEFNRLDTLAVQGKIGKKEYIQAVEYAEYLNALQASNLLRKGIASGVFPQDAHWPVAPSFAEHYQIQIEAGHSRFIGDLYDQFKRSGQWQSQNTSKKNWMLG